MEIFGIPLVGINEENGQKLLYTLIFMFVTFLLRNGLRRLTSRVYYGRERERVRFWTRQAINHGTTLLLLLGLLSIWFDDPTRLATALGLVTAGLAFALQRVVTAIAGYFVILRGTTFSVGDRVVMGGVRGDVIALDLIHTTIMEMGQPPSVQNADPAMWVRSRQPTGRVVTVSNARIFDEPVFNYSRDFPYLWEEMSVPISFGADRERAEHILLEAAKRHTVLIQDMSKEALTTLEQRYFVQRASLEPRVYYRLTDKWLELTVRFVVMDRGIRDVKDAMSRHILTAFDEAGIGIASATFEIVGLPPLRLSHDNGKSGNAVGG
jgi:small-conductance mechanosensitive channel